MSDIHSLSASSLGSTIHTPNHSFIEADTLHKLKHYLPAQAPLKDFVHHNTLHAFQHLPFFTCAKKAATLFGYKTALSIQEFRKLYKEQRISKAMLKRAITQHKGGNNQDIWLQKLLTDSYPLPAYPRIGALRSLWKHKHQKDLDSAVHPLLFRILGSYLDQGIALWHFPNDGRGFLDAIRHLENNSYTSLFKTPRARLLLQQENLQIPQLLKLLVGDEQWYEQYLFDQQFAHSGWSGMVSFIEDNPSSLVSKRSISLKELIIFELLMEIDSLTKKLGNNWQPLCNYSNDLPIRLFSSVTFTDLDEMLMIWQTAFEWTYYDQVLASIAVGNKQTTPLQWPQTQALFCIDDRECSLRRYVEQAIPNAQTFGTPGFFGVEFYFQAADSQCYSKQCPAPITPQYLIKEKANTRKRPKEWHFTQFTHALLPAWLITHTIGYWSAAKLAMQIFRPSLSPASAHALSHMDVTSTLVIEHSPSSAPENGLQVGFTITEMADRVEKVLRSIGLTQNFAPIVYVIGHGASSVNNPHYAAYDCGACNGRPGSVNARVFTYMANHVSVRTLLFQRGLHIPTTTQFVGALHDTTKDELTYYDEDALFPANQQLHLDNIDKFESALQLNAKERARRFESVKSNQSAERIHAIVKKRAVSLFEPRPELNHATNAITVIGRRACTQSIFLDRRSFLNSYDYTTDLNGDLLLQILKAATPVCGGINLEYYFSRVDNQKLGAGTKLPHNVVGLLGVTNGADGDLRPGLPSQMIEVHDPVRMMFIVEHYPEVILDVLRTHPPTYNWFLKNWVHLVAIHPTNKQLYLFVEDAFVPYIPAQSNLPIARNLNELLESTQENIPIHLMP